MLLLGDMDDEQDDNADDSVEDELVADEAFVSVLYELWL